MTFELLPHKLHSPIAELTWETDMQRDKSKTKIMTRYGRREEALQRYGSMTSFFTTCQPMLGEELKSVQHFARVLDNQPCTPAQARVVEDAIEYYLDRPRRIMDTMKIEADKGKHMHSVKVSDYLCLRASLRLDTAI